MNPCPVVIHEAYPDQASAEAEVRHRAARERRLYRALPCHTCGYWRVERTQS